MAEILCLICNETVTFGENCKCFLYENNDKQYSQPRLDILDQESAGIVPGAEEYLSKSIGNYSNLFSEFEKIKIKDYENVNSSKKEYDEEVMNFNYINRIRNFCALTDETRTKGMFQNEFGDLFPSNFWEDYIYSDHLTFEVSGKPFEADYKPETEFRRKCNKEPISTSIFHQQKCETDPFHTSDKASSKECEMMWPKNNYPCFSLEQKIPQNPSDISLQETHLETNGFSTTANFPFQRIFDSRSIPGNTNFWPVGKENVKMYKNVSSQSEKNLMESLNFPEDAAQPFHESKTIVDKESKSIEPLKSANNVMEPSESHSDFITSPNRRFDVDLAAGEFAFKSKTDNNTLSKSVKRYECGKCKEICFNRTSFIRHYNSHSAKNLTASGDSQNVHYSKTQLEIHTLDNKTFACNICRKRFARHSHFINHYRIHTKEKPFMCDLCKRAFRQQSQLNTHYRIHFNEKSFACDKCGKRFARKSNLDGHERTHTGEKPYKCNVCEKRFNHKHHLVDHHRTHTGEKPYECGKCRKRFSQRSSLNVHNRIHANEKLLECDLCQKIFKDSRTLVTHHSSHTAEKP